MITTQKQLRAAFWAQSGQIHVRRHGWTQNQYPAHIREMWCEYVEWMARMAFISDSLASRATL